MAKKLRNCPFCGRRAVLVDIVKYHEHQYAIRCTNQECLAAVTKPFFSENKAVVGWNNRKEGQ